MSKLVRASADVPSTTPNSIDVTFTFANNAASFSISPDSLTMQGAGSIQFNLAAGSTPGSQFAGFGIKPTSPNQDPNRTIFNSVTFAQQGQKMIVHDNNGVKQGDPSLTYDYSVGILFAGNTYWSDPRIINDPPPGPGVFELTLRPGVRVS